MSGTRVAVGVTAADADHAHGQVVQHGTVSDLLIAAHRGEGGDRVDERDEPGLGQAGGDAGHVRLRDPGVEEAIRMGRRELLDHVPSQVAGDEEDPIVGRGQLEERLDQRRPHSAASSSRSAWWASSGVRLR